MGSPESGRTIVLKMRPDISRHHGWRSSRRDSGSPREAIAPSAREARRADRSESSSSIGVERSASVKRISSPRAASIPRRTAAPLPSLRGARRKRTSGKLASISATEPSVEPSSATTISHDSPRRLRYSRTIPSDGGSRSRSL
jgi:hypothetical protein